MSDVVAGSFLQLAFLFIVSQDSFVRNKITCFAFKPQLFGVKAGTIFFKSCAACDVGAQA